ncbi:MAG: hypothetical protein B7Z40_08570 [Bosea sp. 12-68-7]|nr:MAG: hypothetical protein B7Z40_08570 [Bosea sp. 12-68-7]
MNPISIRDRSPAESQAIQRQFKAAQMRSLFASIEAQLTDPCLLEMTRHMRDTVMSNPEFAQEEEGLSLGAQEWIARLQQGMPPHDLAFAFHIAGLSWKAGQELLDAGLVEKACNRDGCTTYAITPAGRAWRAS